MRGAAINPAKAVVGTGKRSLNLTHFTKHEIPQFGAGDRVFRRYTLQKIIGRGGMGIVWLAQDAPRPVSAVKRSPKNGRYFRTLTVVDQYTRECPFLEAAHSLTAAKVAHALDTVVAKRGYPESITWTPAASFAAE